MADPIRISRDELQDPQVDEVLAREAAYRGSWQEDGAGGETVGRVRRSGGAKGGQGSGVYLTAVLATAGLALLGALLAWGWLEVSFFEDVDDESARRPEQMLSHFVLNTGAIALIVAAAGAGVGAADALLSRAWGRALKGAGLGLAVGLFAGFLAAFAAQFLFGIGMAVVVVFLQAGSGLPNDMDPHSVPFTLVVGIMSVRAAAWSVFGLATGVAPGIMQRSRDLLAVGVLGGVLGGFLGGLAFDPVEQIFTSPGGGAELSRAIGFGFMGLVTGLSIGLVEQLSKDAWLYMEEGPLAGKQFVLYKDPTKVGSSPKCDIFIFKDSEVSPEHAYLRRVGAAHEVEAAEGAVVLVNGKRVGRERLSDGDEIKIGRAKLRYYVRSRKRVIR